jgi:hypothetical protein
MSARKFLKHHQEDVRKKIQVIELVSRLQDHVNGVVDLSSSQIQAAKILLDKTVSNAPQVLAGDEENPLTLITKVERVIVNAKD